MDNSIFPNRPQYGAISQQAIDKGVPTFYWSTPDGREVEVTGSYDDPECSSCAWPDKVLVGELKQWLRSGKPASGNFRKLRELRDLKRD